MNSKIVEKDENSQCIAVSATGDSMESPLDPRFGRCSYFIVVEADGSHRAVRNPGQDSASGAGTQAAQKVVDLGVKVVITGNLGPNAFMVLDGSGIAAFMKPVGTVSAAIEAYRRGELTRMGSWTSPGHHGHGPHGPNRNG
ncbi:MAG: NifB/NifX family molybdenum-iron cluster-binding protein [Candidatus Thermoplasmatota archaeon]|nr:NifB/NifX family molybdenum-iron cluster-binding protein [Candidatus Thermoplasmatota archaeon]